jgi:hypothetical protein
MEKEFVPYQLSLAMKELGYNEQCFGFWSSENTYRRSINDSLCNSDLVNMFGDEAKQTPSAPTWQQAFRWLRDKYGLFSEIQPYLIVGTLWRYSITDRNSSGLPHEEGFDTYEEAELECFKKIIEIVKAKKII